MSALNELRRHLGLDWKQLGREETRARLEQSLARISEEEQKVAAKLGAASVQDLERMMMSGHLKGKEAAAGLHQYTRMCSLARLVQQALEELEAPDPDAIEDEFEGVKQY